MASFLLNSLLSACLPAQPFSGGPGGIGASIQEFRITKFSPRQSPMNFSVFPYYTCVFLLFIAQNKFLRSLGHIYYRKCCLPPYPPPPGCLLRPGAHGKGCSRLRSSFDLKAPAAGSPVTLDITLSHQRLGVSVNELKIAGGRAGGQSERMSALCGASSLEWGRGSQAGATGTVLMN